MLRTAQRTVELAGPTDVSGFRAAARGLVAEGVAPDEVRWVLRDAAAGLFDASVWPTTADEASDDRRADSNNLSSTATSLTSAPQSLLMSDGARAAAVAELGPLQGRAGDAVRARTTPDLFGAEPWQGPESRSRAPVQAHSPAAPQERSADRDSAALPGVPVAPAALPLRVPRTYVALAESVALHSDPDRYALLYTLLWRLQHEPALRGDPLDPQWMQADRMARAVHRDQHKMKAFVRFRPVERGTAEAPLHVAWFEPDHHIVASVAPFFARRFAQMHWSVLTPQLSVSWDGQRLRYGPGVERAAAPGADAGEALWLTYYEHIFNPARLKLAMMRKEMPRRYWKNLPEAALIQPLAALAHERSGAMIEREAREPARVVRRLPPATASVTRPRPSHPDTGNRVPSAGQTQAAREQPAAERTTTLAEVQRAAGGCQRCPLYAPATQTVFGEGPVDCRLMVVGEQPGDQEDLRGKPFVGPAGQLFDRALVALEADRRSLYVTNAVKHFKFELRGKRRIHKTPAQQEVAACIDWLEQELALVQPQAVLALGATAARAVLGRTVGVLRERGQWLRRDDGLPVLVTLHPSALLRLPDGEREAAYVAWLEDLRTALMGPPTA